MFENIVAELKAAGPGIAGSMLALMFLRRPPFILAGMFVGGCVLSYYLTPFATKYFNMHDAVPTIGFLIGTFGMAVVAKVYDTIEAIKPGEVVSKILDVVSKRFGG